MSRSLKALLASSAFALLCLYSIFPWAVRADDIVITSGTSSEVSPFNPSPRYLSWRARIYGDYIGEWTGALIDQKQPVVSTCPLPCGAGSSFRRKPDTEFFTTTPLACIILINGQIFNRWFRATAIKFSQDSVIIPLEAASGFTQTTQFIRSDMFWLSGHDRQTAFEPVTMIPFGNGLVGYAARYPYSLSNTNLQHQPGLTAPDSSATGSFKFSKRAKPLVREPAASAVRTGFRPMFELRIPAQFWRRIDLGDKKVVPATRLPIRSRGYNAPAF